MATLKFSILTNFVALLGGKIKSKQMISGNMADIVSNLYLAYSVLWYDKHFQPVNETNALLRDECIHSLMNELDTKMNLVIANYPFPLLKPLLYPMTNHIKYENLETKNKLYKLILANDELHTIFKNDIYYRGTVLEKMEELLKMKANTDEYNKLYQDIISVGEYPLRN
jgi:ribosome assembly protein YihI (activator of Der GTPase)